MQLAVSVTLVPAVTVDEGLAETVQVGGVGPVALRNAEMKAASALASVSEIPPGKMGCIEPTLIAAAWIVLGFVPRLMLFGQNVALAFWWHPAVLQVFVPLEQKSVLPVDAGIVLHADVAAVWASAVVGSPNPRLASTTVMRARARRI